jgi:glyoxylase-like metal-dependent hydrolase (beta-lactamase superfamily II)
LWQNGYGIVMPPEVLPNALPATQATLELLAGLGARVVIPGHGEPFADVDAALERAFRRTRAFAADSHRMARHALKVLLVFTLLDRERMPLASLPAYVDRVAVYREFNERFFQLPADELAETLVAELERAGAVRRVDGDLLPA